MPVAQMLQPPGVPPAGGFIEIACDGPEIDVIVCRLDMIRDGARSGPNGCPGPSTRPGQ